MKWKAFYDRYEEMSENTQRKHINALENFGSVDEIIDVVNTMEEAEASLLIRKALASGVLIPPDRVMDLVSLVDEVTMTKAVEAVLDRNISFTPDQIMELDGQASKAALSRAARRSTARFSADDILDLESVIDDDVLRTIDKEQGLHALEEDWPEDEMPDYGEKVYKAPSLIQIYGGFSILRGLFGRFLPGEPQFKIGDHVRVRYRGAEGTIQKGFIWMNKIAKDMSLFERS